MSMLPETVADLIVSIESSLVAEPTFDYVAVLFDESQKTVLHGIIEHYRLKKEGGRLELGGMTPRDEARVLVYQPNR